MGIKELLFGSKSKSVNNTLGYSYSEKNYGESLRNSEMIVDISRKMTSCYESFLHERIACADKNSFQVRIRFAVSRAGVFFFDEDGAHIDVAFNDYGYSAVEDKAKRNGISWILQNIVTQKLEVAVPQCKVIQVGLNDRYWSSVDILVDISINRFVEL